MAIGTAANFSVPSEAKGRKGMAIVRVVQPSHGDGGGGGAYQAKAVHFADTAQSGLSVPMPFPGKSDDGKCFGVVWLANAETAPSNDPLIDIIPFGTWPNEVFSLFQTFTINGIAVTQSAWSLFNSFADVGSGTNLQADTDDDTLIPWTGWTCIAYSQDTNHADPDKRFQIAIDGVVKSVTTAVNGDGDVSGALTPAFGTETKAFILTDGFDTGVAIDAADFQYWQGIAPDLTDIAVMAKIISGGKPVDPAELATYLGVTQTILCQVTGADPTEFCTNKGNGGTGSLAGDPPSSATTSPSD